jgi:hypothetical protein
METMEKKFNLIKVTNLAIFKKSINAKLAPFIQAPHIPHGLQSEYCSTGAAASTHVCEINK